MTTTIPLRPVPATSRPAAMPLPEPRAITPALRTAAPALLRSIPRNADPDFPYAPLAYTPRTVEGHKLLALDPPGGPRVVEVFGDLVTADHIVVMVPGNGHHQGNYFRARGPLALRSRAQLMLATTAGIDPEARVAVVAWVGYRTAPDLRASFAIRYAREGAGDLARLTHYLPRSAHLTVVGHSYGTTVTGLALADARIDDVVALGSPGMGLRHRTDTGRRARIWAAQAPTDWIRHFPRVRFGPLGLGRSPLHPAFGAVRIGTGDITGHLAYYDEGSESLLNAARIALGRFAEVTLHDGGTSVPRPELAPPGAAAPRPAGGPAGTAATTTLVRAA
ncbi:alpha/beta hydrolase [Georgenia sp. Z1344]|uniref:alpha/beta hydrolase n=1 Tax=Georgenia sp. Z1344 TaxID=3416706 RepID=UPI003CEC4CE3